jgi:hypothetical protein
MFEQERNRDYSKSRSTALRVPHRYPQMLTSHLRSLFKCRMDLSDCRAVCKVLESMFDYSLGGHDV